MPATASEIEIILANLRSGLTNGAVEVEHDGRRVRYRSVDEILKAIEHFNVLLDALNAEDISTAPRRKQVFVVSRSGW